jgi:hypothetical protein
LDYWRPHQLVLLAVLGDTDYQHILHKQAPGSNGHITRNGTAAEGYALDDVPHAGDVLLCVQ